MALPDQNIDSTHHCLPRQAQVCPACGELMPLPNFCAICGEDITSPHHCLSRPLPHVCTANGTRRACLACGQPMPAPRFCVTCGTDITPLHQCPAAYPTDIRRHDPFHKCPVLALEHCASCGETLPAQVYCGSCGMEITPPHICAPPVSTHVCSPLVTMPRRCSRCGEMYPPSQHCTECGADLTHQHICAK